MEEKYMIEDDWAIFLVKVFSGGGLVRQIYLMYLDILIYTPI